ncbi:hypothetical protein NXY46_19380 [Bacteroides ovatus]|nr:hypothetical protein [Bacteroides ovatus]
MRFLITLKKETVAKHSTFDSGGGAPIACRLYARRAPGQPRQGAATYFLRYLENGCQTKFSEGGACGLYVVRGTQTVYSNVKLTAERDADTGGLVWKTESPTPLTGGLLDEHYYFYYPYQARASILGQGGCSPSSLR